MTHTSNNGPQIKLCRAAIWSTAGLFMSLETQGVYELRQIYQVTIFALLLLIANYQLNTARYYQFGKKAGKELKAKRASYEMFTAALLAILDAGIDQLIQDSSQSTSYLNAMPTSPLFYTGWTINLVSTILAAKSLSNFVEITMSSRQPKIDQECQ